MVVAIVSAIRTAWKNDGNDKDEMYFWRNAMSNIWYSSEVAGTIIVQCVPILRPLIRDIHTSLTSKKLASTYDTTGHFSSKRATANPFECNNSYSADCWAQGDSPKSHTQTQNSGIEKRVDHIQLREIPEESGRFAHDETPLKNDISLR